MADLPEIAFAPLSDEAAKSLVIFAREGEGLSAFGKALDEKSGGTLRRAMEAADFKPKKKKVLDILAPHGLEAERVLVVGLGKDNLTDQDWLALGGVVRSRATGTASIEAVLDVPGLEGPEAAAGFALGFCLRGYEFRKYKTKKKTKSEGNSANDSGENGANGEAGEGEAKPKSLTLRTAAHEEAAQVFQPLRAACEGVFLARDLVNEPANILTPGEFATRLKALESEGLTVEILDDTRLRALGMNSLLAVGQGSAQPSYVAVLRWNGDPDPAKAPAVFVGKGVCFDTGGISIKPAQGMEDMKGDMGGAAAVAGALLTAAKRKARANVAGIVGLVENMPDGAAQRPGDIITSASGQTIEVLNTDAEGRLVLADLLWYAQQHLNPAIMVTLATLTGAIIVALGKEYAGLFSNDDALAEHLTETGQETGEKVWRLPLNEKFDKMLDSKIADMKNIGGREAGSITAAQFLQRFVDKGNAWAHLDVAGTAMASPATEINQSWGSGYGVRLLDRYVRRYHESES
jgi:leucyl aminopeptidase